MMKKVILSSIVLGLSACNAGTEANKTSGANSVANKASNSQVVPGDTPTSWNSKEIPIEQRVVASFEIPSTPNIKVMLFGDKTISFYDAATDIWTYRSLPFDQWAVIFGSSWPKRNDGQFKMPVAAYTFEKNVWVFFDNGTHHLLDFNNPVRPRWSQEYITSQWGGGWPTTAKILSAIPIQTKSGDKVIAMLFEDGTVSEWYPSSGLGGHWGVTYGTQLGNWYLLGIKWPQVFGQYKKPSAAYTQEGKGTWVFFTDGTHHVITNSAEWSGSYSTNEWGSGWPQSTQITVSFVTGTAFQARVYVRDQKVSDGGWYWVGRTPTWRNLNVGDTLCVDVDMALWGMERHFFKITKPGPQTINMWGVMTNPQYNYSPGIQSFSPVTDARVGITDTRSCKQMLRDYHNIW